MPLTHAGISNAKRLLNYNPPLPFDALATDDSQWAAQLADHLLAINKDDIAAKQIKADALTKLARNTVNATARNDYLAVARELREDTKSE